MYKTEIEPVQSLLLWFHVDINFCGEFLERLVDRQKNFFVIVQEFFMRICLSIHYSRWQRTHLLDCFCQIIPTFGNSSEWQICDWNGFPTTLCLADLPHIVLVICSAKGGLRSSPKQGETHKQATEWQLKLCDYWKED